jgi:hypothetical protein
MEMLANVQYPKEAIVLQKMQLDLSGALVMIAEENDHMKRLRLSAKNALFNAAFLSLRNITTPIIRKAMPQEYNNCEKIFIYLPCFYT